MKIYDILKTRLISIYKKCFKEKSFERWSKRKFLRLPERKWNQDIGEFDSLIIIPTNKLHDSGFRMMYFIAVKDGSPFCKLGGCSDVIHIGGIGGYGKWLVNSSIPKEVKPRDWSIDVLPKSGLLRIFTSRSLSCGPDLSSFELYSE